VTPPSAAGPIDMIGDDAGTFIVATGNPHKLAEISAVLGDRFRLTPLPAGAAEVVETARSLRGNARLKATAARALTGLPALSDDTGLYINVLGGRPGPKAARFAGRAGSYAEAIRALLAELRDVPPRARGARFTTCAVAALPDGEEVVAYGTLRGRIAGHPRGSRGFGYDSIFIPDAGCGRTLAEASDADRLALSHRAHAFRRLAARMKETQ
jgi:XTP/dITP diphosphohydrolase